MAAATTERTFLWAASWRNRRDRRTCAAHERATVSGGTPCLALSDADPDVGAVLVGPGRFTELAPQVGVAGPGDRAPPLGETRRVLPGHEAGEAHERLGPSGSDASRTPRQPGTAHRFWSRPDRRPSVALGHRRDPWCTTARDRPRPTRGRCRGASRWPGSASRSWRWPDRRRTTWRASVGGVRSTVEPPRHTTLWRRRNPLSRLRARVRSWTMSPRVRHRSRTPSWAGVGMATGVSSPARCSPASRLASRRSVFTRSPEPFGIKEGATTSQRTPIEVSRRWRS